MPLTAAAHEVQQALHFGVIVDDLAVAPDVDEVVRVQPVVLVDVDLGVAIAQGKDHPGSTQGRICRYLRACMPLGTWLGLRHVP